MEEDFLGYLKEWELEVSSYDDVNKNAKMKMLISKETRDGLYITGMHMYMSDTCLIQTFEGNQIKVNVNRLMYSHFSFTFFFIVVKSFIEMTKYLLTQNSGDKIFFLSERISQDPIENYFGRQRARGGQNEHPTMQQCLYNAAALRTQKSIASDPVRGNCSRKRRLADEFQIDSTPLPKRKRRSSKKK